MSEQASVAQLAEQRFFRLESLRSKPQVVGSSPTAGSGFPSIDKFIGGGFVPGEVIAMVGNASQGIHPVFSKTYIRRIGVPILFDTERQSDPAIWDSLFAVPKKKITYRSITSEWEPTDNECHNN